MMKTNKHLVWVLLAALFTISFVSCNDDNNIIDESDNSDNFIEQYIIAASGEEAIYLLQTDNLKEGDLTIKVNGYEVDEATAWIFHSNKYAYRLVYNQGNPGIGSSFILDESGKLKERSIKFEVQNRFTTYGTYGDYVIMAASGATAPEDSSTPLSKYGVTFTYIDVENQVLDTKTVVTENMTGNGEYFTVSGILEKEGKFYTALCPQGLSEYGVSQGYAIDESLIVDGAISATQYPDSVWVAIYDGVSFENPKILRDDRISYATSRYRSQFYSTIAEDDKSNIYVFSSSNSVSNSGIQRTSKPSGVIRIKAGTEYFDQDYYCNIENLSGGCRMYKVWHITEDYFLLQMFVDANQTSATAAGATNALAVFKAEDKKLTWVSGLPSKENLSSFGNFPCFEDEVAYMPVVTSDGNQPAIYIIDPLTATATKGITVTSNSITAIGKLSNKE